MEFQFKTLLILPVSQTHTIINVGTMMVKLSHTSITNSAMLCPQWSHHPAGVTESQDVWSTRAFPLVIAGNFLDGAT